MVNIGRAGQISSGPIETHHVCGLVYAMPLHAAIDWIFDVDIIGVSEPKVILPGAPWPDLWIVQEHNFHQFVVTTATIIATLNVTLLHAYKYIEQCHNNSTLRHPDKSASCRQPCICCHSGEHDMERSSQVQPRHYQVSISSSTIWAELSMQHTSTRGCRFARTAELPADQQLRISCSPSASCCCKVHVYELTS